MRRKKGIPMTKIRLSVQDKSTDMMHTLALVYVIQNWDAFVEEMGLDRGPDGPDDVPFMHDEIAHHTSRMLYYNEDILKIMIMMWGEEKAENFIHNLLEHNHDVSS